MSENKEDTRREKNLTENDAGMIHTDLRELIRCLNQFNKYLDIFFIANGIYDKAADVILLQMLEGTMAYSDNVS